jgi:antitoxin PrlF
MDGVISSKRQVTIPKAILDALKLRTGDRVQFEVGDDGTVRLIAARRRPVTALKGMLPKPRRAVSLAEMDTAIARGAARK